VPALFQIAPATPGSEVGITMTFAVEVAEIAAVVVRPPMKPLVEVTGPEKVVEAMCTPFAQGFASQSVQRQEGGYLSAKLIFALRGVYSKVAEKERGDPKTAPVNKPTREE